GILGRRDHRSFRNGGGLPGCDQRQAIGDRRLVPQRSRVRTRLRDYRSGARELDVRGDATLSAIAAPYPSRKMVSMRRTRSSVWLFRLRDSNAAVAIGSLLNR